MKKIESINSLSVSTSIISLLVLLMDYLSGIGIINIQKKPISKQNILNVMSNSTFLNLSSFLILKYSIIKLDKIVFISLQRCDRDTKIVE